MAELKNNNRSFLVTFWYEYKSYGKLLSGYINVNVTTADNEYPELKLLQEIAKSKLEKRRKREIEQNNLSLAITYIHEFPGFDQYAIFHGIGKDKQAE